MNAILRYVLCVSLALLLWTSGADAAGVVVVQAGQAKVAGVYLTAADNAAEQPLHFAVRDLVYVVQKMTGATLQVVEVAGKDDVPAGPAIVVGELAGQLGQGPVARSLWKDSMRTVAAGGRLFVAGESNLAAACAVMDLLHEAGARWFLPANIPGNPGEIIPSSPDLAFAERDHERHPRVRSRRVWGHNLGSAETRNMIKWVRRVNGISPVVISESHAWAHLIPKEQQKPEHFAIKRYGPEGQPLRGGQLCVSNPQVAELAANTIISRFRAEPDLISQSISPNDGGGACICLNCQALDPANYLEPSSGKPALSDRYLYFYNQIAQRVAKEFPDRYLAFYVYSDYSRAPIKHRELHPMLLPVFAPIRYPRMQSMSNPLSEPNIRLKSEINAYAQYARNIGYYGYNYNLAETIVPFSKISIWSQDLVYLAQKGMTHTSLESLGNWNSNGPHIYLSARYIYSGEEPAAIMDDYFAKLGGSAAGPLRDYWQTVDRAFAQADIHSGSFYGIEHILTGPVLAQLQGHLDQAAKLAAGEREKAVVAFFQSGLEQGKLVIQTIRHLNAVEFLEAKASRDQLNALSEKLQEQKIVSIYPVKYMQSFVNHVVEAAAAIPESGGKIVTVLPNTWHVRMDHYNVGLEEEWFAPGHGSSHWQTAKTWGAPSLYSQGFGDVKGFQWFKVEEEVPATHADKMVLWFGSNDGSTRLWINGQPVPFVVTEGKGPEKRLVQVLEMNRSWRAFSVPVGKFLQPGKKNTFVLRIDHSLNDLNLGGILRPVLLYIPGDKEMKEIQDTYEQMTM